MQVVMPEIASPGFDEAEILALLVRVGQHVLARQPVLELEAGKASFELASPATGRVEAILVRIGDDVRVGDVVLTMRPHTSDWSRDGSRDGCAGWDALEAPRVQPDPTQPDPTQADPTQLTQVIRASPAARRRAAELGVDLEALACASDRVTIADVEAHASQADPPAHADPPTLASMAQVAPPTTRSGAPRAQGYHHIQELVDVTSLDAARRRYHDQHEGPPLRLLSFAVKACAVALREHPRMNSSAIRSGRALAIHRCVHLGVQLRGGPAPAVVTLEHADQRPLAALTADLAEALAGPPARDSRASSPTFMVTRLRGFTNPWPKRESLTSGGLALGRVHREGARAHAPLQLAYDPRIHERRAAQAFLARVTELLCDPFALLVHC
jgi:pyruvate dehydrogenase E2 component (dihydrolipoamide acetyltransferase)